MPKSIHLLLGFHCHQPVGNFDSVFEESTRLAYRPFLEVLKRHPRLGVTLHYSGILLDWLDRHDPALLADLRSLVAAGSVEMLTGGFYEPILSVIPEADQKGQIAKLTGWLQARLGATARGLWLTERVWEPQLARSLAESGVEFLCADDSHFKAAGLEGSALTGRYVTEEGGRTVEVFPILEKLRSLIPFRPPRETLDYLASLATEGGDRCAVMADDGEKFGAWPHTHDSVYGQGWLEEFFRLLEENADWIHTTTLSEYRARSRPLGRVYLPTASYTEMMEWALPAGGIGRFKEAVEFLKKSGKWDDYGAYLRGGYWRNFFLKYEEANNLHKKMLWVSRKVENFKGEPALKAEAQDELWQGQCNCPFWHGVFGGLYLNHLRFANYRHLIGAETLVERRLHKDKPFLTAVEADFDCDGARELLVESESLSVGIDPARGGRIFELDDRQRRVNLGDTMTRRFEAYHSALSGAAGVQAGIPGTESDLDPSRKKMLAGGLMTDWYRKVSLLDHCLPPHSGFEEFSRNQGAEWGDFIQEPYELSVDDSRRGLSVRLSRQGNLWMERGPQALRIEKELLFEKGSQGFSCRYRLKNMAGMPLSFRFGVEFNFGLLAGASPGRYWELAGKPREGSNFSSRLDETGLEDFSLMDEWLDLKLRFRFKEPAGLWAFPVETVSQSEGGFDKVYQNTLVMPQWQVELALGQERELVFELGMEALKPALAGASRS